MNKHKEEFVSVVILGKFVSFLGLHFFNMINKKDFDNKSKRYHTTMIFDDHGIQLNGMYAIIMIFITIL